MGEKKEYVKPEVHRKPEEEGRKLELVKKLVDISKKYDVRIEDLLSLNLTPYPDELKGKGLYLAMELNGAKIHIGIPKDIIFGLDSKQIPNKMLNKVDEKISYLAVELIEALSLHPENYAEGMDLGRYLIDTGLDKAIREEWAS